MTKSSLIIAIVIVALLLLGGSFAMWHRLLRLERLKARIEAVRQIAGAPVADRQRPLFGLGGIVADIGSAVARSGILSRDTLAGLRQSLTSTGFRGPNALASFIGMKLLLMLVMPLLAYAALRSADLSPLVHNAAIAGAALAGLLGPDWWIGWKYKRYLRAVTQGLADALDLMVICAEAGLSFAPAMTRVAYEIRHAHPAVSQEFGLTASEFRVMADSQVVLHNMGARTGLEGIKRMTSMLAQTMKYGTPLGDALRVLSAEMRQEMLIRYETRAARLPVLLTIPMILFILPCIFLIVGGPAVIQVMHTLHH